MQRKTQCHSVLRDVFMGRCSQEPGRQDGWHVLGEGHSALPLSEAFPGSNEITFSTHGKHTVGDFKSYPRLHALS